MTEQTQCQPLPNMGWGPPAPTWGGSPLPQRGVGAPPIVWRATTNRVGSTVHVFMHKPLTLWSHIVRLLNLAEYRHDTVFTQGPVPTQGGMAHPSVCGPHKGSWPHCFHILTYLLSNSYVEFSEISDDCHEMNPTDKPFPFRWWD